MVSMPALVRTLLNEALFSEDGWKERRKEVKEGKKEVKEGRKVVKEGGEGMRW